ncbi:MAG: histidine kinase, partial [Planctomycetales bacterium]|nr:histidine kinase [Planctomycetales bacterium]
EKATGVKVKERVPDFVLGLADQLVNVDLSAEDLRERLAAGKIYPAERVGRALESFFTQENLTRLREFAMEEIAHRLDRRQNAAVDENLKSGAARVMVCLSSRGPHVERLLRKAARLADRLSAPWYAVYIQTPQEDIARIDAAAHRTISNTLTLVQQLGGVPMTFKGRDVASTIGAFVREYGITHVVLGRTQRPWYRHWWRRPMLDRLLSAVPEIDVMVVGNP